MREAKVILISGKAGSGKDTVAEKLKEIKERDFGAKCVVVHYADYLKLIAKLYFGWDGKKDEKGRELLQWLGTDVARKENPDIWLNVIHQFVYTFKNHFDYVIIPDTRFPNEITGWEKFGFEYYSVVVIRDFESSLTLEQQQHMSEVALDGFDFDCNFFNKEGLENLEIAVKNLSEVF